MSNIHQYLQVVKRGYPKARQPAAQIISVCNTYALLNNGEVKVAEHLPSSFFAFSWTVAKSRSTKAQKKNKGNI